VGQADDTKPGREVALKALPEEFAKDPVHIARFERQAMAPAIPSHTNLATLHCPETVASGTQVGPLALELVEAEAPSERRLDQERDS
jgi:hypothetical protein